MAYHAGGGATFDLGFMVHKLLELQGLDQVVDMTPRDEEEYERVPVTPHRVKKVTVKRGTGRHGERVDESTVQIQSNAEDQDAALDAEIGALT